MARKRQEEGKKGLDEWMATYSDMVTLLLCFFVLLYAASTPNETKWQYIFQSFVSRGQYLNPFVMDEQTDAKPSELDGSSDVPLNVGESDAEAPNASQGKMPQSFSQLFNWVEAVSQSNDMSSFMSVEASQSRMYIRFDSSVMFEGDSAILTEQGQKALKLLFPGFRAVEEYIQRIIVSGHTAEGISAINGWDLSAARACSVTKFMDFNVVIPSEKYKVEGSAEHDPIAPNDTEEGRSKNRRVELVLVRNAIDPEDTEIVQDVLKYDYNMNQQVTDPEDRYGENGGLPTDDQISQIIADINGRYDENAGEDSSDGGLYVGPTIEDPLTEISEDMLDALPAEGEEAADETNETDETAATEEAASDTAADTSAAE